MVPSVKAGSSSMERSFDAAQNHNLHERSETVSSATQADGHSTRPSLSHLIDILGRPRSPQVSCDVGMQRALMDLERQTRSLTPRFRLVA